VDVLGFLDKFRKKKAKKPVKPLETPPGPTDAPDATSSNTPPAGPNLGMPPGPQPQSEHIQPNPMPEFSLPPQEGYAPGMHQEPEHVMSGPPQMSAQQQSMIEEQSMYPGMHDMSMPAPPEEDVPQHPAMHPAMQEMQQPQFKFHQAATPEEVAAQGHPLDHAIEHPIGMPPQGHQETHNDHPAMYDEHATGHGQIHVPFDVSQELLTLPEVHRQEHPELYKKHEEYHDAHEMKHEQHPFHSTNKEAEHHPAKHTRHTPKKFITMTSLYETGEQLVNLAEDLSLAKDTAFRLTDLNEQEIEQMAKWHTLHQSIELRIAEVDKVLFKTKV
jgi:hypothetical protein